MPNNVAAKGLIFASIMLEMISIKPAEAGSFSRSECKLIAVVSAKVIKAVGKDTLSVTFRQSLRNWIGQLTCDGPTNIRTPTGPDIAAFNTIRSVLAAGNAPIDLTGRGLRSVR